jgi:YhcH/YjgK/YiaL family protein
MIFDQIKFSKRYKNISERMDKALLFLSNENLQELPTGRFDISGDEIFCLVNEYTTKSVAECSMEAHKNYIDIQSIIYGKEQIGYSPLSNQTIVKEYDVENDYALYEGRSNLINMEPGLFVIFFPNDLHMPGISEEKLTVKKIVIKVRI